MTVNIKQAPFYPGLVSDEDQDKIRGSDLWPIVLALHFNTGGKILVTEVVETIPRSDNLKAFRIHMRTKQGAHVLGIKKAADGEISVHQAGDMFYKTLYKNGLVFSTDSKYITSKLKPDTDLINRIKVFIQTTDNRIIPDTLTKVLHGFANQIREVGTELQVQMTDAVQKYALRALFDGDKLKLQPDEVNGLKEWYKKLQEADGKKAKYDKKYAEMFTPLKHLLIHARPDIFISGQIKNVCRETDYKIKVEVPQELTMIKNISDDPQLMAGLTFWKVLRESRKEKYATLGTDGMLLNQSSFVDLEAGSMLHGENNGDNGLVIYLVHKTGEEK